jgi:WD40 repeat protein
MRTVFGSWLALVITGVSPAVANEPPAPLLTLKGDEMALRVAYSPDGKVIATSSAAKTAALWDAASGKKLFTLRGHTDFVGGLAFSPDSSRLATGSGDLTVKVWDTATGREVLMLPRHNIWVYGVAFSPDGTCLATGGMAALDKSEKEFTGEVTIWDATTGKRITTLRGHSNGVLALAYSPDGKRLVSGSLDGTVIVWDLATGRPLLSFRGHAASVLAVALSPDGKRLVTGGDEAPATVWELGNLLKAGKSPTEEDRSPLPKGRMDRVLSLAFSPDGKHFAVAGNYLKEGWHGEVKVWDLASGRERLALGGGNEGTYCVAFSPDGRRLAVACSDGTVKVWGIATLLREKGQ